MPDSIVQNVGIRGIACAVPRRRLTEDALAAQFGPKDAKRLTKSTGVLERRVTRSLCTSDLCVAAAEALMRDLCWEPASISHLIFVTQTPDYFIPATACIIQDRLKLPTTCAAFDVNLGCSGYPYGLWIAAKMMEPGQRALLLAGDITFKISKDDRATIPILASAGSATALEYDSQAPTPDMAFSLGTDGSGYRNIIVEAGRCRVPLSAETTKIVVDEQGNKKSREHLHMNGAEVFAFSLREVPDLITRTLALAKWEQGFCDDFVFHQANRFMLEHIAQKLDLPPEKVPMCLEKFGNTSSASIPLALHSQRLDQMRGSSRHYLLAGFGIGWSWAACALTFGPIVVPDLVEVDEIPGAERPE